MGRGIQVKLRYVNQYRDRHGKLRRYFRRPGSKRVPLPGSPNSPEFMAVYQAALTGAAQRQPIGAARNAPGSVASAVSIPPRSRPSRLIHDVAVAMNSNVSA